MVHGSNNPYGLFFWRRAAGMTLATTALPPSTAEMYVSGRGPYVPGVTVGVGGVVARRCLAETGTTRS